MKASSASFPAALRGIAVLAGPAWAQTHPFPTEAGVIRPADPAKFYKEAGYSPYAGRHYPTRPLWGDQHVHTGWSADAGMAGAALTPEHAVRFARGDQVTSTTGQPVRLSRPLDWVAITDHSDGMGVISELRAGNRELMADPVQKRWHDMMLAGGEESHHGVDPRTQGGPGLAADYVPVRTAYDAKYFKVKMDENVPMTTQEHAWSSPVLYTP
ncbi:MAG: DUF3604 domain-containing protein, partial [Gammaproteobacteria bacterium]